MLDVAQNVTKIGCLPATQNKTPQTTFRNQLIRHLELTAEFSEDQEQIKLAQAFLEQLTRTNHGASGTIYGHIPKVLKQNNFQPLPNQNCWKSNQALDLTACQQILRAINFKTIQSTIQAVGDWLASPSTQDLPDIICMLDDYARNQPPICLLVSKQQEIFLIQPHYPDYRGLIHPLLDVENNLRTCVTAAYSQTITQEQRSLIHKFYTRPDQYNPEDCSILRPSHHRALRNLHFAYLVAHHSTTEQLRISHNILKQSTADLTQLSWPPLLEQPLTITNPTVSAISTLEAWAGNLEGTISSRLIEQSLKALREHAISACETADLEQLEDGSYFPTLELALSHTWKKTEDGSPMSQIMVNGQFEVWAPSNTNLDQESKLLRVAGERQFVINLNPPIEYKKLELMTYQLENCLYNILKQRFDGPVAMSFCAIQLVEALAVGYPQWVNLFTQDIAGICSFERSDPFYFNPPDFRLNDPTNVALRIIKAFDEASKAPYASLAEKEACLEWLTELTTFYGTEFDYNLKDFADALEIIPVLHMRISEEGYLGLNSEVAADTEFRGILRSSRYLFCSPDGSHIPVPEIFLIASALNAQGFARFKQALKHDLIFIDCYSENAIQVFNTIAYKDIVSFLAMTPFPEEDQVVIEDIEKDDSGSSKITALCLPFSSPHWATLLKE